MGIEMGIEMETNWIPDAAIYRNFCFFTFYFFVKIFEIVYELILILKILWIWIGLDWFVLKINLILFNWRFALGMVDCKSNWSILMREKGCLVNGFD